MTDEDRSALVALVTEAVTAAIAPLCEELQQNTMQLQAIEARLTAVEDRMFALEQSMNDLAGRMHGVEIEIRVIHQQLARIERNAVLARTEDRKLIANLRGRVEALEAK